MKGFVESSSFFVLDSTKEICTMPTILKSLFVFVLVFFITVDCFALTGTVSVSVSPGHQTVKVRGAGDPEKIGVNTAQYSVTAACDPQADPGEEVKPVDPSWSLAYAATFMPPQGVTPVPQDPGTLSVNISGDNGSWTAKMHSSAAGMWKITFTATVTYKLKNSETDEDLLNDDGSPQTATFDGTGSCTFKATAGDFKIVLLPDDNFEGRSLSSIGVGETGSGGTGDNAGKIYVEPIGDTSISDIFPLQDFSSSNTTAFLMYSKDLSNGTAKFEAGDTKGNTIVSATDKNGKTETYPIEILEPQKIRMEPLRRLMTAGDMKFKYKNVDHNKAFRARICLVTYIEPTEVSFFKITVSEGAAQYNLEGDDIDLYADNNIPTGHDTWARGVSRGNALKGCHVDGPNAANTIPRTPLPFDASGTTRPDTTKTPGWNSGGYGPGKSTITLPWRYSVGMLTGNHLDSVKAERNFDGLQAHIKKQNVTEVFDYFPNLVLEDDIE